MVVKPFARPFLGPLRRVGFSRSNLTKYVKREEGKMAFHARERSAGNFLCKITASRGKSPSRSAQARLAAAERRFAMRKLFGHDSRRV
jgi:hypothetical protein